jgi:hypothetical protein
MAKTEPLYDDEIQQLALVTALALVQGLVPALVTALAVVSALVLALVQGLVKGLVLGWDLDLSGFHRTQVCGGVVQCRGLLVLPC